MKDLNKWLGIGRLGKDPEVHTSSSGTSIVKLAIACSDDYKDKNTGQLVDKTEWVRVVAFNKLADIMSRYLKKGSRVYIEGKYTTRKYQDNEGNDRYTTEIIANEMQMLDTKDSDAIVTPQQAVQQPRQQYQHNNSLQPAQPIQQQQQPSSVKIDDYHDDIVF